MMENKPTSFDIAKRAGVSQPTVSRALRNSPLVNKETRELVHAIAKEMNYNTKGQKRNRKYKASHSLTVFFGESPDKAENPFLFSMIVELTKNAARLGYDLIISNHHYKKSWMLEESVLQRTDGLIFLGHNDYMNHLKNIGLLDTPDIPYVAWGQVQVSQPGCFVGSDNVEGGLKATKHLIEQGHKKIAFIGNKSDENPELAARHQGYVKALLESNIIVDPSLHINSDSLEARAQIATQQLFEKSTDFTAIFCASDLIAMGAIRALHNMGKSVPGDIAIVGFDDIPKAAMFEPRITTVKQNAELASKILVEELIEIIEGKSPQATQLPTELIIRESCGYKETPKTEE